MPRPLNHHPALPGQPAKRPRLSRRRRTGSAYVVVLAVMMVVFTISTGALLAARAQGRTSATLSDAGEARSYALSAIELARVIIDQDANWRTTRSNGVWISNQPIGGGTLSLSVVNPRGALNRADNDPVTVVGTGVKGSAVQYVQVTVNSTYAAYTALSTAATSGGAMSLGSATVSAHNQIVASNAAVTASSSGIDADIESGSTANGSTYSGKVSLYAAARTLPDPSSAFTYYMTNGIAIPITSLPTSGGSKVIKQVLLCPQANPYGSANAQGIYVIDCQGQNLVISDCRIVGTLVLLNPGSGSSVTSSVNWVPAVTNYPCLMVYGNMSIALSSSSLTEVLLLGVNYNPSGTPYPYPNGTWNLLSALNLDSFPSQIAGLVYVSGNLQTSGSSAVNMLTVGGTLTSSGTLTLGYVTTFVSSPPPGFRTITVSNASGSWKRVVQ